MMKKTGALLLCALFARAPLAAAEALQEVTVREGDTLWSIAQFYLKDPKRWPDVLKHNPQLSSDPTVALPGMRLRIPVMLIKENLRTAELIYILKDVRTRRKDSSEWTHAKTGQKLAKDDGVRTLEASAARIRFPTGEVVNLSENSLVIVRPEKGQDSVELLSGDVRAAQSRVLTAGGTKIDPQGPGADYSTRVKNDKTELVLVFKGAVNVTAQGRTIRVPEGFGSEVRPLMPPTEPIPLPKLPHITRQNAPGALGDASVKAIKEAGGLFLSVDIPVAKSIGAQGGLPEGGPASPVAEKKAQGLSRSTVLSGYHLQVDGSNAFENPLLDKVFPLSHKFNLKSLNLPDGSYWWRLAMVDSLGLESAFSSPQPFKADCKPPVITLTIPQENEEFLHEEEFVRVAGETEPGAIVQVEGKSADVDPSGRFSTSVYLHEGKNRLALVVRDESGNETKSERVVYRKTALPGQARAAAKPGEEERRGGFLFTFGMGILAIGTILGIIVLIAS